MGLQEITAIIQTLIGAVALIISIITLTKVNHINQSVSNKIQNKQVAKGTGNTQTINNQK